MKKNSAYIGKITVGSNFPIIVYGSVRGFVSEHRTLEAAEKSLSKDHKGCKSQGGYSDALIFAWNDYSRKWLMAPMSASRKRAELLEQGLA